MNFSSALVCMLAPFFGFETPITVSQMLWVNMIMDTLGGLAFAGESPRKRIMKEKPKRRDEPILNGYMIHQILISGGFSAIFSILFLTLPSITSHFRKSENNAILLSAFFGLFIFIGIMQCINSRTDRLNLINGIDKNPTFILIMLLILIIQVSFIYFGGTVLRATPLTLNELLYTITCASLALPIEFLRKIIWRFSGNTEGF
jgi:magnesium-transporting ATPase (P-type)